MLLERVLASALELIAPRRCAACDATLSEEVGAFCGPCGALVEPAPRAVAPPACDAALFRFEGPLADAVRRWKYGDRRELASALGALLVEPARAYGGLVDAVVPVPLHPRRLRARGFNPAALLAAPVAHGAGVPCVTGVLVRARSTRPQAGLDAGRRAANVAGAFAARGLLGRRVLLVDDVRTTGATLAAARAACLAVGAAEVRTLALGLAPRDAPRDVPAATVRAPETSEREGALLQALVSR